MRTISFLAAVLAFLLAAGSAARAEDFYVKTGQTGAQTQIDVAHTSSFTFQPSAATSFAGGIFTMKGSKSFTQTFTGAGGQHTYTFGVSRN